MIKPDIITAASKTGIGPVQHHNISEFLRALEDFGPRFGLDKNHRLAHFIAQVMHESGEFLHMEEIWGPTDAQRRYEGRADLGNTQRGDGHRFKGHGPIQLTGRDNHTKFNKWVKQYFPGSPDFVQNPELVAKPYWGTLAAIWFWETGNRTGKSLNRFADDNNIEMVTKIINGGLNGYSDRIECYDRTGLAMLGFGSSKEEIRRFQAANKKAGEPDGISGAKTRMAIHAALSGSNPFETTVAKVPDHIATNVQKTTNTAGLSTVAASIGSACATGLFGMPWQVVATLGGVAVLLLIFTLFLGPRLARNIRLMKAEIDGTTV